MEIVEREVMVKPILIKLMIIVAVLIVFSLLSAARATAAEAPAVWFGSAKTGTEVSLDDVAGGVAPYDVIFFGEFHDSQPVHDAELAILKRLCDIHDGNLVLSLEMFERDVQPVLNDFLAGKITETEFLAASRPWPQYMTAYRPLIMYAKKQHIPVLAGNIPRRIAASYAKSGTLGSLTDSDTSYLPKVHLAGSAAYQSKFFAAMSGMEAGDMKIPAARRQQMFMAQCLKDDAMAESIAQYKAGHPAAVVYHVQGVFHSEGRLGVVEKLHWLNPRLKIAVIDTVQYSPDRQSMKDIIRDHQNDGDYLVLDTQHKN